MTTFHDHLRDEARALYLDEIDLAEAMLIERLTEAMRDGEVPSEPIRFAWVICPTCDGDGGHSRGLGVIDPDRLADDYFMTAYLRGDFDSRCERCQGSGKVREIDEVAFSAEAQAWITEYRVGCYESAEERRAERAFGC